jgi:transcription elongation factor GreA
MDNKRVITRRGLRKLESELKERTTVTRKRIADKLDEAKAVGDLSENSAYAAAVEEYQHNESRIKELKEFIKTAEIAPDRSRDADIDIGDKVRLKDIENNKEVSYEIVGLGEGDPAQGQVSSDSVVGSALMGKKVGDKVEVSLPKGKVNYKIVKIE